MTNTSYRLPADLSADTDVYEREVRQFLAGDMPAERLKAKRVPRGVYEQRNDGTFMVRVRVAGGTLTPTQASELSALSREFANGQLHVTTRQDIQLHDVAIENTPAVMRRLMTVGLTSKGGGGNTVRNITACPYAGMCPAERFDVTPGAHAVTEHLIALTGSYNLPRKYKIAFSGCAADCSLAQVADLGFIAEIHKGAPGFRVMAGGGMGAQSRKADVLEAWVPATEIIRVSEAVRRLFDQVGDRSNKHRARLRFAVDRLGIDDCRRRFRDCLRETVRDGVPEWVEEPVVIGNGPAAVPNIQWRDGIRVIPQRQPGFWAVPLHAPLGFLPAGDIERLGALAARYSAESGFRTTIGQNLLLRFVTETDMPDLVAGLRDLTETVLGVPALDRFVACAGASTCRLGICLARSAARACAAALEASGVSADTRSAMRFHINGCSNACGQQPIAPIGFFGSARRTQDGLVPSYTVSLGGRCGAQGAQFGTVVGKVPAASLPEFVRALAVDFEAARRPEESFQAHFARRGLAHFQKIAKGHADIPGRDEHPEFYRDLGAEEDFSLAGRGAGECGVGVFDVIQQDLTAAKTAVTPFDIVLPTARALLITRGVDAQDPDAVFRAFEQHFVETGLVPEEFRPLLSRARGHVQGWEAALDDQGAACERLRDRVGLLYSTLDANLEFHPPDRTPDASDRDAVETQRPISEETAPRTHSDDAAVELDLRGVSCPMNFVKAKLRLEPMNTGDILAIVLDDGEPVRNVPASFRAEGQEIVACTDLGDGYWRVGVKKVN